MRVLVGCEFSGVVRRAFRERGHDAWSCDLIPSLDASPHHLQCNVLDLLYRRLYINAQVPREWDLLIAHPSCDRLLGAGALHWKKWQSAPEFEQQRSIVFFMQMALAPVPRVAVENPTGIMNTVYRRPDQIIQPWMFGHKESKATCLWLHNLPPLRETNNVYSEMMELPRKERERVHFESPGVRDGLTRSQRRAIFFPGFADAMADQWGLLG